MLQTTVSNFPGSTSGGTLSNTLILSDDVDPSGSVLPTLTVTTEVIANVAGLSSGFVTGATRTTVESQSLATFTLPSGAFLTASSDVNGMVANSGTAGGTVQNTTSVNGTEIASLPVGLNSGVDALISANVNAPAGYTLTSEVVFAGGTPGVSGLVISATSGVANLTPEPASFVVWGLGAAGLGLVAARRRFGRSST
jgi:MYXO-CTERM domain-containing protein